MIGAVIGYAVVALFIGLMTGVEATNLRSVPSGSEPAVGVIAGLVWPVTVVAALAYALYRSTRAVVRSFVILWRHWRPAGIPRVTVHRDGKAGEP